MTESHRPETWTGGDNPDDALGRALRAAARDDRPAFSESLHARIVAALPANSPRASRGWSASSRFRQWSVAALAGSLLVAFGLVAWQSMTPEPTTPLVAEDVTAFDPVTMIARTDGAEVGLMLDQTLVRSQWAYLDHDAKIAANLLIEQLPFRVAASEQP